MIGEEDYTTTTSKVNRKLSFVQERMLAASFDAIVPLNLMMVLQIDLTRARACGLLYSIILTGLRCDVSGIIRHRPKPRNPREPERIRLLLYPSHTSVIGVMLLSLGYGLVVLRRVATLELKPYEICLTGWRLRQWLNKSLPRA